MASEGTHLIRTLKEVALYPPHPPRKATPEFNRNHHQMIVVEDLPCASCGVCHSDLQDPTRRNDPKINPFGASQMELHHWIYEDAMCEGVDLDYFNEHTRTGVAKNTGDTETYTQPFTQEQMEMWIHGHRHNLLPLDDMCHRHPYVGIHAVTYPLWRAIRAMKKSWSLTGFHPASPVEAAQLEALPQTTGKTVDVGQIAPPEPGSTNGEVAAATAPTPS